MKEVLYFGATWCGPCRTFKPTFEQIAADNSAKATFTSVDIDAKPDLAKKWSISGVPTVVVVGENGQEEARGVGVAEIEKALAFLK